MARANIGQRRFWTEFEIVHRHSAPVGRPRNVFRGLARGQMMAVPGGGG
jgi:hypothetical protein